VLAAAAGSWKMMMCRGLSVLRQQVQSSALRSVRRSMGGGHGHSHAHGHGSKPKPYGTTYCSHDDAHNICRFLFFSYRLFNGYRSIRTHLHLQQYSSTPVNPFNVLHPSYEMGNWELITLLTVVASAIMVMTIQRPRDDPEYNFKV
jgi:hypothetical protein